MPFIIETIVTTRDEEGRVHIAPLGLIQDNVGQDGEGPPGDTWIIAPFRPSRTLDNLMQNPFAVASHVDDVRVFASCVVGRRNWPVRRALKGDGAILNNAAVHWEMQVERVEEDSERPRLHCRIVHQETHRAWLGYNRAQAAVIEAAVLVTRLSILPREKIEAELAYLKIAIDKTAGPHEREAWAILMERVEAWRRGDEAVAAGA